MATVSARLPARSFGNDLFFARSVWRLRRSYETAGLTFATIVTTITLGVRRHSRPLSTEPRCSWPGLSVFERRGAYSWRRGIWRSTSLSYRIRRAVVQPSGVLLGFPLGFDFAHTTTNIAAASASSAAFSTVADWNTCDGFFASSTPWKAGSHSLAVALRAQIGCADGVASKDVAAELGLHEHTVGKWRRRFLKDRCDGLLDEARPGRLEESTTRLLSRDPDRMRALLRHSVIVESPTPHCRHRRAVRLNEQLRLQWHGIPDAGRNE